MRGLNYSLEQSKGNIYILPVLKIIILLNFHVFFTNFGSLLSKNQVDIYVIYLTGRESIPKCNLKVK